MAHKKAGGSSRNGRDSAGRRLGIKMFGGEKQYWNIKKGTKSNNQKKWGSRKDQFDILKANTKLLILLCF